MPRLTGWGHIIVELKFYEFKFFLKNYNSENYKLRQFFFLLQQQITNYIMWTDYGWFV